MLEGKKGPTFVHVCSVVVVLEGIGGTHLKGVLNLLWPYGSRQLKHRFQGQKGLQNEAYRSQCLEVDVRKPRICGCR